jgi:methylglutaconyl-CoA hydratase
MIKSEIRNNTGIIFLSRPEKRNALHPELINKMKDKLSEFENNNDLRSVIITGEGSTFCAGADLEYLNLLKDYNVIENEKDSKSLAELFLLIYNYPKPTIAAVNGAAIAGGCGLATVCDLIVAHPEHSLFGYSEVKIGFVPAIVSIFLMRRVGEGIVNQLLLEAGTINAQNAYEVGLVNYLYNNVLEGALEVASRLNNNSKSSLKLTKAMIKNISNLSISEAVDYCINLNTLSRSSDDFKAGLSKFLKRD